MLGKPCVHFIIKLFTGFSDEAVELCKIFFCESVVGKYSSLQKTCTADSAFEIYSHRSDYVVDRYCKLLDILRTKPLRDVRSRDTSHDSVTQILHSARLQQRFKDNVSGDTWTGVLSNQMFKASRIWPAAWSFRGNWNI